MQRKPDHRFLTAPTGAERSSEIILDGKRRGADQHNAIAQRRCQLRPVDDLGEADLAEASMATR
jgi:hypothetical protein